MRKRTIILAAFVAAVLVALPALAGNGAPSGSHYNLNIIGVDKGKTADMTGSNRHSIFVPLRSNGVATRIYLTQGDFKVCDGNGFDAAYDCSGNQIGSTGATFMLPQNEFNCAPGAAPNDPCWNDPSTYYVFARGLGAPGGYANMTTCMEDADEYYCSTETVTINSYTGGKGGRNTKFQDVTKGLTTLCLDTDDDNICDTRELLFSRDFFSYFWEYDNHGLKLAQLRFYPVQ